MDGVFTIAQLLEKHQEFNIPTYLAFINYHKASDKVSQSRMWNILHTKGIPQHLIRAIQSMYIIARIRVKIYNNISNNYRMINQGVKQGCVLSPVFFNLYIYIYVYVYNVIIEWQKELRNHCLVENTQLNTLSYADYQIVVADSENNLQRAVHKLWLISNQYNLNISTNKTKVMAFIGANTLQKKIVINDQIIEQVNSCDYLGCSLSYIFSRDIDNKLAKFQQLIGTMKSQT
jgi:hypothetical protein